MNYWSNEDFAKKAGPLRIGIDLDDVVADLMTAWLARFNAANGTSHKVEDLTQWALEKDLGVSRNVAFKYLTPDIYDEVKPIEGAIEAVRGIDALGHYVLFVSNCKDSETFEAKRRWLIRNGLSAFAVCGTGNWSTFKHKDEVPVDWLIDDHVGNLDTFPGYCLLVTRPHNRLIQTQHKRIKHLRDAIPLLRYPTLPFPDVHLALSPEAIDEALANDPDPMYRTSPAVRRFETGATRDVDTDKLDYEAFLSPTVLKRYAEFMHKNRFQKDGSMRAGDNWAKGIPLEVYMKSAWRHFMEWWLSHRRGEADEEALVALMFNTMGYLHETLKTARG